MKSDFNTHGAGAHPKGGKGTRATTLSLRVEDSENVQIMNYEAYWEKSPIPLCHSEKICSMPHPAFPPANYIAHRRQFYGGTRHCHHHKHLLTTDFVVASFTVPSFWAGVPDWVCGLPSNACTNACRTHRIGSTHPRMTTHYHPRKTNAWREQQCRLIARIHCGCRFKTKCLCLDLLLQFIFPKCCHARSSPTGSMNST